jgi:hypothetical protein
LLESTDGKAEVLTHYLADLRTGDPVAPLSDRITAAVPQPAPAVIEHLKTLPIQR